MLVTSLTVVPVFAASWLTARLWSRRVIAVNRFGIEVGGVAHGDQRVGVGRVADDEDLDVLLGALAERRALRLEDAAVGAEQIAALHAGLARHRADEQGDVGVAERDVGVVGAHDIGEQRERAVVELHLHAAERAERRRDLEQLQDHGRVGPEHRPGGDAEQQAVADLAGSTGDGNTNRCSHAGERRSPPSANRTRKAVRSAGRAPRRMMSR